MHGLKVAPGEIKEVDPNKPEVVAYISTGTRDRVGEILSPDGWDLESFKRTGVVSIQHLGLGGWFQLPIGKALDVWTDEHGLLAHTQFLTDAPGEYGEWAQAVAYLVKEQVIKSWSIWFDPFEWVEPDGSRVSRQRGEGWGGPVPGRVYTRQEMLEYGPAYPPANTEAATIAAKTFHKLSEKGVWVPPPFLPVKGDLAGEDEEAPPVVQVAFPEEQMTLLRGVNESLHKFFETQAIQPEWVDKYFGAFPDKLRGAIDSTTEEEDLGVEFIEKVTDNARSRLDALSKKLREMS